MKKFAVLLALLSPTVWATAQQTLTERLDKVDAFGANFVQNLIDPDGNAIDSITGELVVKRPNRFFMRTELPTVLTTDGDALWFFDEMVEEVLIQDFEDMTAHTPFVLLTRNQASDWQDYTVTQNGDVFLLTPNEGATVNNDFEVSVLDNGRITQFSLIEQDGQRSDYVISDFMTDGIPHDDFFSFKVPDGVNVVDQR